VRGEALQRQTLAASSAAAAIPKSKTEQQGIQHAAGQVVAQHAQAIEVAAHILQAAGTQELQRHLYHRVCFMLNGYYSSELAMFSKSMSDGSFRSTYLGCCRVKLLQQGFTQHVQERHKLAALHAPMAVRREAKTAQGLCNQAYCLGRRPLLPTAQPVHAKVCV
jgi:hypothetical protein